MLDSDKELNAELKSKALNHLRRVCGRHGVIPASYVLAGVARDDPIPQKTGIVTEIWKGVHENKAVAIKIFKVTEGQKDYDKIKTVRQVFSTPTHTICCSGRLTSRCSRDSEVLQRGCPLEAIGAQKCPPPFGCFEGYCRTLFNLTVDEERLHYRVRSQQPARQPPRIGMSSFYERAHISPIHFCWFI